MLIFKKKYGRKFYYYVGLIGRFIDGWTEELVWAVQRLKGKALISQLLRVGWTAFIYQIWRERNSRVFKQKEEDADQILEHISLP